MSIVAQNPCKRTDQYKILLMWEKLDIMIAITEIISGWQIYQPHLL